MGSFSPNANPGPTFVASGDNWDFRGKGYENGPIIIRTNYTSGGRVAALTGALDLSGTSVTAVMAVWGGCTNDLLGRFTGTRNGLELDMSAVAEGVTIHVVGTLSSDLSSFNGTYTSNGGRCGTADPQPMTGQRVELDAVWSDANVTMTLAVATDPGERGSYAITGTVVLASDTCFPQGAIGNAARGRLVFPNVVSGDTEYLFDAEVTLDQQQMRYVYWSYRGSCIASGEGTLTRQ